MKINVATDFSVVPSGRTADDGPDSGERFRREVLVPALRSGEQVHLKIDDVLGSQSSFLEEAFGPLQRELALSADELLSRLIIEYTDERFESFASLIKLFVRQGR